MTDSNGNTTYPAGWYPDPSGAPVQRWWNGTAWTEDLYDPSLAVYGTTPPLVAGQGTPVSNGLLWVIVLLPLVSLIANAQLDMTAYLRASLSSTGPIIDPAYAVLQFLGFAVYAATIVLAFFDHRRLSRLGVSRPFHWAWAFLWGAIYVFGRTIVVRRRVGGSLAPIWTWAAITVLTVFVAITKMASAISELAPALGNAIAS
ncbi:DUF2510 domain-containing protein [Cryobacterium psychrophilum]|uniref:DUF2510 domain-containing protein n=1 Tax=Cryobacterium psychrophilum TaxID=41988 RepID=A0A4Y8KNV9_9MICO|nr:DUF2510 domain-containing protein [Cryobacterium psychrophilum]TDW29294.1 uncharacterized protein DUF2510 [Cryobacterium psychrophilum]TFD79970.1 DUF2510 domain-containing protein [Cryobacterium psychrophilum]